uniref:TLDc domain-containing protein n=2 Tax=Chrysotila carterae TaxID=13221 RepID=A0A7S4EZN4_CHRCT|mmetsp:Transcript_17761/g.34623  ORF Transcript_17761/g.34623 Transcript_17761/m.34623 type:complete len:193 (+) Transcript_17761:247-825(+)
MLMRTDSGQVLGGWVARGVRQCKEEVGFEFCGDEQTTLLRLTPSLGVFRAVGEGGARAFCYLNNKRGMRRGVGLGGSVRAPRLWLEPGLNEGTSASSCSTFESGMLGAESFGVSKVEVWGTGGWAAERALIDRRDAQVGMRRRGAARFLRLEATGGDDDGAEVGVAAGLAQGDSWLLGLLSKAGSYHRHRFS